MKKILVINFRYFGDALISASLSVRIRELWPDAHITYLVFDSVEGVLEGIETIDEILTVPERPGKWEQFRWMVAHWNNYDLAFVTQTGTREALQKPLFPSRIEQNCSVRFFFTTSKKWCFFCH